MLGEGDPVSEDMQPEASSNYEVGPVMLPGYLEDAPFPFSQFEL